MKTKTLISAGAVLVLAASGCGSTDSGSSPSSPASPSAVAITSWATWAQHYGPEIQNCAGQTDECFTENHSLFAEMRQSIVDNNLPIDGTNSGIANPMQLYQETYAKFTEQNCIGAPQEINTSNVVCNVSRQQLEFFAKQVATAAESMEG